MRILPQNPVLHRRRVLALAAALTLSLAGCAKFPANPTGNNTRLIVTMRVAGHIKNGPTEAVNYFYYVAFNPSQELFPTATGPEPVTGPPWGNGFVAGGVTHFVQFDFTQPSPYGVYQFLSPELTAFVQTGVPVTYVSPGENGNTIQFEIDLSQITPNGVDPDTLQSVQMNFLTMDVKPTETGPATKHWDALGDSSSIANNTDYVRIPLNVSRTYTNSDFQDLEPEGDTNDADLDIVDWSVEVRRP